MALPPPFAPAGPTPGFVPGGDLHTNLNDRLRKAKNKAFFDHMGIALADLTNIDENPSKKDQSFAIQFGANALVDKEFPVYSLSKIAAMFAAYSLDDRVTRAAASVGNSATDVTDLVAKITAEWKPIVSASIPKPPKDFPKLEHVFDFTPASPWIPLFQGGGLSWSALQDKHGPDEGGGASKAIVKDLKFLDRMKLMIRFSDNNSAGSCVRDVSFQYMNRSLASAGFNDKARNGILWLGGDFGYGDNNFDPKKGKWVPVPTPIMQGPPWDHSPDATWVRASARGIASFFTLAWTNRLVSPDASREMRSILLERSPEGFVTTIGSFTPNKKRCFGKPGQPDDRGPRSDGLVIECHSTGRGVIRYAAAALKGPNDDVMKELAEIFFEVVDDLH
jgi:hypothetical protein